MEELKDELQEQEKETQKDMFMTFQAGKEYFGINISYVKQIIAMQPITVVPEVEDYIKGLINLRGKIIPVLDVRVRFKMPPKEYTDRTCIIVIDVKSTVVGLIVEKIAEVDTILNSDIVPPPTLGGRGSSEQNKYVYGLAKTGEKVKLLLDPEKLIKQEVLEVLEEIQEEEQS